MSKLNSLMVLTILAGSLLLVSGCKKSDSEETQHAGSAGQVDTFEEPTIGESGMQGYQDVVLTAEDEELRVPGAAMGPAPKAKKAGKKKKKSKEPSYWPQSDGIADQMEGLMWGMSVKKVFSVFEHKIRGIYKEKLQGASGDLLAEDRIRTQMLKELQAVKASYVEFKGQTSGYEAHMVAVEFSHNNSESILVWDAEKFVEYLFFIDGRFWKRVRLFRVDELGGLTYDEFVGTLEGRFGGPGKEIKNDTGVVDKIVWRDDESYAAIVDGAAFYGVYGIRFTSAVTHTHLAKLRTNKGRTKGEVSSEVSNMVDHVTTSVDLTDHKESVIDSYTGADPTEGFGAETKKKMKEKSGSSSSSEPSSPPASDDEVEDLF